MHLNLIWSYFEFFWRKKTKIGSVYNCPDVSYKPFKKNHFF